jgi:hypothetical protein
MTKFLELIGWRRSADAVKVQQLPVWQFVLFAVLVGVIAVALFRLL